MREQGSDNQGLIPRFVTDLFDNLNSNQNGEKEVLNYKVKISFLEIYGEDVFDLISSSNGNNKSPRSLIGDRAGLPVREDEQGKVFVQGQNEIETCSADAVLECLCRGSANRVTASTNMNAGSSRSHAVFTITLEQNVKHSSDFDDNTNAYPSVVTTSKLTFVDLAGSERIKRTGAEGQRLKEGIQINSGLFNLGLTLLIT